MLTSVLCFSLFLFDQVENVRVFVCHDKKSYHRYRHYYLMNFCQQKPHTFPLNFKCLNKQATNDLWILVNKCHGNSSVTFSIVTKREASVKKKKKTIPNLQLKLTVSRFWGCYRMSAEKRKVEKCTDFTIWVVWVLTCSYILSSLYGLTATRMDPVNVWTLS